MKELLIIILFTIISCETDKRKSNQKEINTEIISKKNIEEIKYVTAKSGLIYRDKAKGKPLGKFELNSKLKVIEHTGIFQEIKDGNGIIKGEWVGVEIDNDKVYIFSGFLSNTKEIFPKPNFEKVKKYLYDGIWVSNEFRLILEKTKLYSKAGYYRDSPHNIIFYEENKVSSWSENEMEELYLKLDEKNMTISGLNGEILYVDNSSLKILIDGNEFSYFKIKRPYTSDDSVFEVVRIGTNQVIKKWFSGKYIFTSKNDKSSINFTINEPTENFLFAWYKDYDNNVLVDIIDIYGDLYKINKVEKQTYFLEGIEPIEDFADPEDISNGIKATLTKIEE